MVVATVGTLSGPAASTLLPIVQGAQLWVRWINARGGLNGHPVQQILLDDGGDPARQRAVAQDAIERRGAVAFLANVTALTGTASAAYINSRRVPVIGWDGGADFPYEYPMFFPQTSAGAALGRSSGAGLAMQMGAVSKTRFGIMFCVETAECEKVIKELAAEAVAHGRREVYRSKVSIAQPDFTAECLSAKNAGVEVLVIVVDTNSVGRGRGIVRPAGLPPDRCPLPSSRWLTASRTTRRSIERS